MAVGSQIATSNILADLNFAVRYRIAISIYASKKFLADFNLAAAAKPPNLIPRQNFRLYGRRAIGGTAIVH